jgi:hypothetical protein
MNAAPQNMHSDFLGRLVDRAVGREEALQPRLPSLYEPAPETAAEWEFDMPIDANVLTEAKTQTRQVAGHTGDRPPPEPVRQAQGHIADVSEARQAYESRQEARIAQTPIEALVVGTPQVKPRSSPSTESSPMDTNERVQTETFLALKPLSTVRIAKTHVAIDVVTGDESPTQSPAGILRADMISLPARPPSATDIRSGESQQEAQLNRSTRSEDPAEHPVRNAPSLPRTKAIVIAPAPDRRTIESLQSTSADQQPTINVTIGRIEVRATAVPAPAIKHRGEPAGIRPMSLDEYLKRRGEGR